MLRRIQSGNFTDTDDEDEDMSTTYTNKTKTQSEDIDIDIKEENSADEDLSDFDDQNLDKELNLSNINPSQFSSKTPQEYGRIKKKFYKKQTLKKQKLLAIINNHMPHSNEQPRKTLYINKQRTLVFASRGINQRMRHLMNDIKALLPTSKSEPKFNEKRKLSMINEICAEHNCNNCLFFESRRHTDLYLWMTRCPNGPACKFFVTNVHTCKEMRLTGNHMRGSRPLLVFDEIFDDPKYPHLLFMKELFVQVFGTPNGHPRSKPFIDHVFSFMFNDGKIWFRNYQIVIGRDQRNVNKESNEERNVKESNEMKDAREPILVEIGPRFVLHPVKIQQGSFQGSTIYQNQYFINPNVRRREIKNSGKNKKNKKNEIYANKIWNKIAVQDRRQIRERAYNKRFSKSESIFDEVWDKGLNFNIHHETKKRKYEI